MFIDIGDASCLALQRSAMFPTTNIQDPSRFRSYGSGGHNSTVASYKHYVPTGRLF